MYSQFLFSDIIDLSLISFLKKSVEEASQENDYKTLEVEIKFGSIRSKQSRQRIELPILLPSIIIPSRETYFESSISLNSHRLANLELNNAYKIIKSEISSIAYKHQKIKDVFYSEKDYKIRQSFSNDSSTCIVKKNIKNLDIYYPGYPYDIRFSINSEIEVEPDALRGRRANFERLKDRISYNFPNFVNIDLTQVTSDDNKVHELEIEFDMDSLASDLISESFTFVTWLQKLFLK
jgi:polynucleotide 5'-triphosphatase